MLWSSVRPEMLLGLLVCNHNWWRGLFHFTFCEYNREIVPIQVDFDNFKSLLMKIIQNCREGPASPANSGFQKKIVSSLE